MENYTDYEVEIALKNIAIQLGIDLTINPSPKDLFSAIEHKCPEIAEIVREEMFEKDKLKAYLLSNPPSETINGNIVMESDENKKSFDKLCQFYPLLLQAIKSCKSKGA